MKPDNSKVECIGRVREMTDKGVKLDVMAIQSARIAGGVRTFWAPRSHCGQLARDQVDMMCNAPSISLTVARWILKAEGFRFDADTGEYLYP